MSKVYTITLERITTGERSQSVLTRQDSKAAAVAYARGGNRTRPRPSCGGKYTSVKATKPGFERV